MTTDLAARTVRRSGPAVPRTDTLSSVGLAVLLLGMFMAVADFFIVNVALPSIARTLGAGPAALELVVAGYGTAYAVLLVPGGRLGDTRGRTALFRAGVGAFVLASAACGVAPSPEALVVARIVQGASAAAVVPQVLATIQATLRGADRQRALGLFGATLGAAAVLGQLIGGVLVQANIAGLEWRPVFLVNVPIGVAVVLFAGRLLPESHGDRSSRPDLRGGGLLAIMLLGVLIPATMGRDLGWPSWMLLCAAVVPVALVALIRHGQSMERRGHDTLLPPSLLQRPALRAGIGVSIALFLAAGGFFLTTALSLQDGLGLGPMSAGLTLAPFALAFLVVSLSGRRLGERLGSRIIALGAAFYAAGMLLLAIQAWTMYGSENGFLLAPAMVVVGIGQGLVVAPLTGIALAGVPAHRAGTASGLLTTTIQASLAVGAAVIGLVFISALGHAAHASDYGHATAAAAAIQAVLGVGVGMLALRLPRTEALAEAVAEAA